LSINVKRNGTWPLKSFLAIANLRRLREAHLWFNVQSECVRGRPHRTWRTYPEWEARFGEGYCEGKEQFQRPFVGKVGAEEMFQRMLEKNGKAEGVLERVIFWVGDWSRMWDGPIYSPSWVEGRGSKIVCSDGWENETGKEGRCVVEAGDRSWEEKEWYEKLEDSEDLAWLEKAC
jgi:hypothetical protein